MNSSLRLYIAELIGTFVLVFAGVGTAVLDFDRVNVLGVALAFGLALLAMCYAVGPVSGCHINPAVTLGAWISKRIETRHVAGYMIAQLIGGALGALLVFVIAKGMASGYDASTTGFASNGYASHSPGNFNLLSCFLVEVFLTALLVFTVLCSSHATAPAGFAGLAIGLVLVAIHLVGIPVTNLSANPARSIATAIFAGGWALAQLWLFIVAPLIGSIVAAGAYAAIKPTDPTP
jgi:aquaporin Z